MPAIDYSALTSKGMVPNGIYTALIQKVDNTPASTGTPQTRFDLELVAPAARDFAGVSYAVAGQLTDKKIWWSDKSMARSIELCTQDFGMKPLETTEEFQQALLKTEGCYVDVYVESRERVKRHNALPGQKPWQAEVAKDDEGNVITDGWEITNVTFRRGTLKDHDGNLVF